uniref:Putative 26s proteasome regulatory complex n=1 Tax=Rhodnius prolixus TaxID=13249 RepID=R4FNT0_RHOPR
MATVLDNVVLLHRNLKAEWTKKPPNLQSCGKLLDELKIALTHLIFLPTSNSAASQKELLIARDILEIGAQWSIATKNIPSFERYMAQLKCYYLDYKDHLPESAYKYQLLGLNLLLLLSQNRVAEFHTELELLPSDQIQSNVYVRHPLSLEQYLMEGNYNKKTIRNEIAGCLEVAYKKISSSDATRMLNLANLSALKEYAAKKHWVVGKDNYYYFAPEDKKKSDEALPSKELVTQAMEYARELEMIV